MANKKLTGLGKGLGELFEDNAPEIKTNRSKVIVRSPDGNKDMRSGPDLFEKDRKPKNRSVLANYKK